MEEFACFIFLNSFLLDDVVKQLAFLHEFGNEEELFGSLNDFIELNNIRVSYEFQDMNFTKNPFCICDIVDFIFF